MAKKISLLRIFEDENEKMNLSLLDIKGEAIVVSQFTLFADTRKGNRPAFISAAKPELAKPLVDQFIEDLKQLGIPTHREFSARTCSFHSKQRTGDNPS
jgi:D-tyrosyl-tRNA(Tyr) deacylase